MIRPSISIRRISMLRQNNLAAPYAGPAIVRALVQAGANVNACAGVTRSTPLHMAARRGHLEIAQASLDCGAALDALDRKGDTPLQRAINCRRQKVAQFLISIARRPSGHNAGL